MRKAILTMKDQILHKLILIETREPSGVLSKYITPEQLMHLYTGMMVISDHNVILRNITGMDDYRRMNFYYESIIHDYAKKYRMSEDEFKVTILNNCNSLNQLKEAMSYYEFRDEYKKVVTEEPKTVEYKSAQGLGRL